MRVAVADAGVDAAGLKLTVERCGSASSNAMAPSKSVKRPRTLLIRCRTWNAASEWLLSIWNVRVAVAVVMTLS
jgi:hypothetical protein